MFSDTHKFPWTIDSDGYSANWAQGVEYDITDYIVSNNGRTIEYNTDTGVEIYEIPQEIYDLE